LHSDIAAEAGFAGVGSSPFAETEMNRAEVVMAAEAAGLPLESGGGGNRTRVRSRTGIASTSFSCDFDSPAGRLAGRLPAG
jgi:hypothetical protein